MVQLDSKRWSYKGDKTFLESYFILKKVSAVSTYTVHISQKRKGRSHVLLLPRDWSRINVILYIWLKNIWLYILDFCKNNVFNESLWIQDGPAAATPSLGFLGSADAVDREVAPILGFARADGSWPVAQAYCRCRRRRLPSHWDRGRGGGRRRPGWWSRWRPLGFRVAKGGGGELALRWAAVVGGGGKEGGWDRGHVLG